jgi:hypothetical protein
VIKVVRRRMLSGDPKLDTCLRLEVGDEEVAKDLWPAEFARTGSA